MAQQKLLHKRSYLKVKPKYNFTIAWIIENLK